MSFLSRLFGEKPRPEPKPETYKGYRIYAEPITEGGTFRLAARIEMGEGEQIKSHQLIRADVLNDKESANDASLAKARQVIDEQGEQLFK